MNPPRSLVFALVGAALAAGAYALVAPTTLVIDGRSVPAEVRMVGGVPYVRLSDVGRALGMSVSAKGGRYALSKAGGAGPLGGKAARIGDTLFNGRWRFSVVSVEMPQTYTMHTDSDVYEAGESAERPDRETHVVKPGRGYRLVVVRVRGTNGTKAAEGFWTSVSDEKIHNAIADSEGGSHRAIAYDYDGAPTITPQMLPGAQMSFNVLFSLPDDVKPKDLIFTLPMTTTMQTPGTDVRVSLAK